MLLPEHEELIAQAMQTGAYRNVEKIERAFGQFERGEFFSAEESQADMEKRKAVWLHERQ